MKMLYSKFFLLFLILSILLPQKAISAGSREQEIRELVTSFVAAKTAGMGWDVIISRMTINDPLKLPEGKVDYEIIAPKQWEGWGNVNLAVIVRQKERVLRNIPVRLDVEAKTEMVVATHQIEHGEILTETDVVLQKRELSHSSNLAARNMKGVLGKRSRITLRANQVVRADQLEKIPLIKSGQMVTIIAENEVLKISVAGKAKSSGAEGDSIKIQNLSSLKEIPAVVISATTVQVAF